MRFGTPEFKNWMRAAPRPDRVKAYLAGGGAPRVVKVRPRNGVRYWKEVVDALANYEIESVELLDAEGNLLRQMTCEAAPEPDGPPESSSVSVPQRSAAEQPIAFATSDLAVMKQTRLVEFARLLERAYITGATQQKDANKHAFDSLIALTKTAFERLDNLERAYNRVFRQRVRQDMAGGGGDEDDDAKGFNKMIEQVVIARMSQMTGGLVPNGAAPEAPEKEEGGDG